MLQKGSGEEAGVGTLDMNTPTPSEQLILQLVNRARSDPFGEMQFLLNSGQSNIDAALASFSVNKNAALNQVRDLGPVAPLAWNPSLAKSAETHNDLMIRFDEQSHNLPGEPGLIDRFLDAGFEFNGGGAAAENVFAYTEDPLYGQAGFYIDWGNGPNGIQSPPGHRDTILNATYTEVGIAYKAVPSSKVEIGPNSLTQHFGYSVQNNGPYLVGVVIDDADNDDFYDIGEGLGGITVTATGGGQTFSTQTWAAGGYALAVDPNTVYTVTFSGNALGPDQSTSVRVRGDNVAVDAEASIAPVSPPGPEPVDQLPETVNPVKSLTGTSRADDISGRSSDESIFGLAGADRLNGNGGDDTVSGGSGSDRVSGSKGDDVLSGDDGKDRVLGGDGNDAVFGNDADDFLFGNDGDDVLNGGSGNDRLKGGDGNDTVTGGSGADKFYVEHGRAASDGNLDVFTDVDFAMDTVQIQAFNGSRGKKIESVSDLLQLSMPGVSVVQTNEGVLLTFDDGGFSTPCFLKASI